MSCILNLIMTALPGLGNLPLRPSAPLFFNGFAEPRFDELSGQEQVLATDKAIDNCVCRFLPFQKWTIIQPVKTLCKRGEVAKMQYESGYWARLLSASTLSLSSDDHCARIMQYSELIGANFSRNAHF